MAPDLCWRGLHPKQPGACVPCRAISQKAYRQTDAGAAEHRRAQARYAQTPKGQLVVVSYGIRRAAQKRRAAMEVLLSDQAEG